MSMSRYLPGLFVATAIGVASGYYTFQPLIVEQAAIEYVFATMTKLMIARQAA